MFRRKKHNTSNEKKMHGKDYVGIVRDLFIGLFVLNGMAVLTGLIEIWIKHRL